MTYPEPAVEEIIARLTVPVQVDNHEQASQPTVDRFRHIWTPDLRLLDGDGFELYRWNGFLPPFEFAARLLAGVAHARLRLRQYAEAIALYEETLRRFPSSAAAPEATYFLGVCEYRADPDGNDLRKQWHRLQSKFPQSEWRIKQSFIEQA